MDNYYDDLSKERKKLIANRIKEERKKSGYSQEALAEKLGYSKPVIISWERPNGKNRIPNNDQLIDLALLFECETGYLLGDFDSPSRPASDAKQITNLDEASIKILSYYAKILPLFNDVTKPGGIMDLQEDAIYRRMRQDEKKEIVKNFDNPSDHPDWYDYNDIDIDEEIVIPDIPEGFWHLNDAQRFLALTNTFVHYHKKITKMLEEYIMLLTYETWFKHDKNKDLLTLAYQEFRFRENNCVNNTIDLNVKNEFSSDQIIFMNIVRERLKEAYPSASEEHLIMWSHRAISYYWNILTNTRRASNVLAELQHVFCEIINEALQEEIMTLRSHIRADSLCVEHYMK